MDLFCAQVALPVNYNDVALLSVVVIRINNVECAGIHGGGA